MTFAKKMTKVKTVFGKDRDIFLHIMGFHGAEIFFLLFLGKNATITYTSSKIFPLI